MVGVSLVLFPCVSDEAFLHEDDVFVRVSLGQGSLSFCQRLRSGVGQIARRHRRRRRAGMLGTGTLLGRIGIRIDLGFRIIRIGGDDGPVSRGPAARDLSFQEAHHFHFEGVAGPFRLLLQLLHEQRVDVPQDELSHGLPPIEPTTVCRRAPEPAGCPYPRLSVRVCLDRLSALDAHIWRAAAPFGRVEIAERCFRMT
ncbi:hypothetical protein BE11_32670 [Sorangium cellulosum]|nr:hypothetical protein BE11_32670 [Sorangium cellulosum]